MLGYLHTDIRDPALSGRESRTQTFRRVNAELLRFGRSENGHEDSDRHELHSVYTNFRPV